MGAVASLLLTFLSSLFLFFSSSGDSYNFFVDADDPSQYGIAEMVRASVECRSPRSIACNQNTQAHWQVENRIREVGWIAWAVVAGKAAEAKTSINQ
ncbi:uncharacterized protein UTRI_10000 [Ustilago trichophora]|uniref:Uncharacterized protein n=1 Tax=Ustilago trichophora TaxID=86804 RepID=A0A5C3DNW0_9BASI|nr:uncharacterized protein UTRI_10000 [Ustilago trichophora]